MTFRNPWIDPRIVRLRPENARSYLVQRGWKEIGPASDPHLLRYEQEGNEEAATLFLPIRADDGPGLQWMIEFVADVAKYEDRWAVDVLGDMLRADDGRAENGADDATGEKKGTPAAAPQVTGRAQGNGP
jgi:hypothetical protein